MDWDRGTKASAILHGGLILWVALGDWLFAPAKPPEAVVAEVSLVSGEEFQAIMASTPNPTKDNKPAVETPKPVKPELPTAETKPAKRPPAKPKPAPEPAPVPDETVPVSPDPQPIETPEPKAPTAETEQPIQVPDSTEAPAPKPADKITDVPVDDQNDTPEVADQATPKVSDTAPPTDTPPEPEKSAASPEDSAAQIAPDAKPTTAPELAPTRSLRPRTRPQAPVEQPAEDPAPADTATADATDSPADTTEQTDSAAIDDALAAALNDATADQPADQPAETGGQDLPKGPPLTAGEMDGLRSAINKCWNIGSLSTAATMVRLTLRVEMAPDGKPTSITMTTYDGGDAAAAQQAFEAAKRAVSRSVRGCNGAGMDLDPSKYDTWNIMNLNFDASGMRLR